MYGGDDRLNAYVDDEVAPVLAKRGVTLKRVPITDTAEALKRVIAERRAGKRSGGGVDLIWINGENFASGKQAGLWLEGWARSLPNAERYVDLSDPTIRTDFQVAVDGQESPWQRAAFVYAYDSANVSRPPRDLDALLAYARAHRGRFTYPAPPDFTGSAFVRQVIADKGEDAGFAYLKELKPLMYRGGRSLPKSQAELDGLFADGQVDFAMAYDANFVNAGVRKGAFPKSARPFLIGKGALSNTSYVTIPANAANVEGAKVLADVLLDPVLQAAKADPAKLGNPTVLDAAKLGDKASLFARRAADNPYVLQDYGETVPEFAAARVGALEKRWASEVLR
jgi:putative spermidine/putrescine transport system substrate-binding protein